MDTISLVGNQQSHSYGQDESRPLYPGNIVNALVVDRLGEGKYLLKLGRNTFEAAVAADLKVGQQYQLFIEKNSVPPELSLLGQRNGERRSPSELSPAEQRWLDGFLTKSEREADSASRKELLSFLRSLGYDTDQPPEEVARTVKNILTLVERMDAAPTEVRQAMAQTLLNNIESFISVHVEGQALDAIAIENVIKLSGEIPRWNEADLKVLAGLLLKIAALDPERQLDVQALLLGLSGEAGAEEKLGRLLSEWLAAAPGADPEAVQGQVTRILGDVNGRFLLSSGLFHESLGEVELPGRVDRQTAIASFLRQAPGMDSGATASLLEQFTTLGGRLDKLSLGDVLSAQDAWRGQVPQALQVHRTGALLFLSEKLPGEHRDFQQSPLTGENEPDRLPIFLTRRASLDPANAQLSLARLRDFTSTSQLPRTLFIERLLQNWIGAGRPLAELRAHIGSVQAWNAFLEAHPELKPQLTEFLFRAPIFPRAERGLEGLGGMTAVEVLPETRSRLMSALELQGFGSSALSGKYLQSVLTALQQAAGSGAVPNSLMVQSAAWLAAKNFEMTPELLQALVSAQKLEPTRPGFYASLAELFAMSEELPANVADEVSQSGARLPASARALREALSFYQAGHGTRLRELILGLRDYLEAQGKMTPRWENLLQNLDRHLAAEDRNWLGLKQYNLQATRNDTPQLFEIPVYFGDGMERALFKVYHRQRQSDEQGGEDDSYKVVINLDLEALGPVRADLTLQKGLLQLDFSGEQAAALAALRGNAGFLEERFAARGLKPLLSFREKKVAEEDGTVPIAQSVGVPHAKNKIDLSA